MSGGPRQLFDPEAPPEAAASDLRTASGGDEASDEEKGTDEGSTPSAASTTRSRARSTQAFPRNRHLWVRGEIRQVSDHRSGHLYLSLVDPEDESPRRDRSRGGVPTLNVKCWRSSWAPLRHGLAKQGIELTEGMVVVLRGVARPLPGQGRNQPDPGRGRRHRVARATGGETGRSCSRRSTPRDCCGAMRVFPCRTSRCTSAWSPARAPRDARTSSASSRVRASGSVSPTCGSPCRAPARPPPSPGP